MKKFLLVSTIMLVLLTPCFAAKDSKVTYSETVNVPGVSATDLYMKVNLWFSDTFKGPEANISYPGFYIPEKSRIITADKDKGTIQANYTFLTDMQENFGALQIIIIYSAVEVQVSDGKYRLVFLKPRTAANTYIKNNETWSYYKPKPLMKRNIEITNKVWHDLASALRETVGGTLAKDL